MFVLEFSPFLSGLVEQMSNEQGVFNILCVWPRSESMHNQYDAGRQLLNYICAAALCCNLVAR